jgi:transposase
MYVRTVERKHGDTVYRYIHLAESFRTPDGKVRQRMIANLGNPADYKPGEIQKVIAGLQKVFGLPVDAPSAPPPDVVPAEADATALDYGGSYAVMKIFEQIGWAEPIRAALRGGRHGFDVLGNLKVLLANRLLDPCSKLHILEWFKGAFVPGVDRSEVTYERLLRAMDFLIRNKEDLEVGFARKILTLFDQEVDLVFYDVTSTCFEIDAPDDPDNPRKSLRQWGYSRDHRPDLPQVVVGLVMTRDGFPICHHVWKGNTADKATVGEVAADLRKRFGIRRVVFVGDRGMLSKENLQILREAGLDYIVAHKLRKNEAARKVLPQVEDRLTDPDEESVAEAVWKGRRFVVAHHPEIAKQTRRTRERMIQATGRFVDEQILKLHLQDAGLKGRGRPASDEGTLIRIHDYLRDRKLLRYYDARLDEDGHVTCRANVKSRKWENRIDGKLLLETSVKSLAPEEVVRRYKELADIERAFRTMKSSLNLRPVFHRVDRRIAAHAFLCVMALQIDRVMRHRLHAAKITTLPTRVLESLDRHRMITTRREDGGSHVTLTVPSRDQSDLFSGLGVPRPSHKEAEMG